MALHHRREIPDMRHAYDPNRSGQRAHHSDSDSDRSYQSGSDRSYQTQPTSYSSSPAKRPPHVHYPSCDDRHRDLAQRYFEEKQVQESPRASAESYTSTVHSEEDVAEDISEYDLPEYTAQPYESSAVIAATPSEFSDLFPSRRRLAIRHDNSTLDGNMNLRVDTEVSDRGRNFDVTLFHLRMHELKSREFSLRRYCRDSGREVCHTVRKHQTPAAEKRPSFQRSLSNALQSMRPKTESRGSGTTTLASLKRNDSGYDSMHSGDFDREDHPTSTGSTANNQNTPSANLLKLEFSNYAQMDVKRAGVKGNKRYEFEYWGIHYAWRRITRKDRGFKEISYHLTKTGIDKPLAYIVPVPLSQRQAQEEQSKGGWINPCTMWIADGQIIRAQKDVSDVVIASGLMALVDDSIRAHFHSEESKQLLIPIPKFQVGVEYIGPKRLINEMFNRKDTGSSSSSRPTSSSGPPPGGVSSTGHRRPTASSRQPSHDY